MVLVKVLALGRLTPRSCYCDPSRTALTLHTIARSSPHVVHSFLALLPIAKLLADYHTHAPFAAPIWLVVDLSVPALSSLPALNSKQHEPAVSPPSPR